MIADYSFEIQIAILQSISNNSARMKIGLRKTSIFWLISCHCNIPWRIAIWYTRLISPSTHLPILKFWVWRSVH